MQIVPCKLQPIILADQMRPGVSQVARKEESPLLVPLMCAMVSREFRLLQAAASSIGVKDSSRILDGERLGLCCSAGR